MSARIARRVPGLLGMASVLLTSSTLPGEASPEATGSPRAFPESLVRPEGEYAIAGPGFVTDDGHPSHAFQFRRHDVRITVGVSPPLGEFTVSVDSGEGDDRETDRYFVRRGRIFQVDAEGAEVDAGSLGDLRAATVAALHPAIAANAMHERREMVRPAPDGRWLFAWTDELWTVEIRDDGRIARLERDYYQDRLGDGVEVVSYEYGEESEGIDPVRVVVTARGRELAAWEPLERTQGVIPSFPDGERRRDRARVVAPDELQLRRIAENLHAIDVASMNTRVLVAEFADHLFVIEGAYSSRICDLVAEKLRRELAKPVRYFAFSHLHAQYVGGTRSWVHAGARVVVPEGTAPLVQAIATSSHTLRPDALEMEPRDLELEIVDEHRRYSDDVNTLDVYDIDSDHTDDYLIFHFPAQRVLLTGDLLWYREGQPLTGRSVRLCEAIERLELDVDRAYVTWPLDDRYGTQDLVTGDELRAACPE